MKYFLFVMLISLSASAANEKISQLPLGSAAATGINDSFPYVVASTSVTKRLTIYDLINVPSIVATYAKLASPTFTGTVTGTFAGNLTGNVTGNVSGNASTATALAANPTDCSSNTYATTIAANGNLTCASISNASTTGVSTNTASTLVLRDGSGNFSAGTITASLTGNASTATSATSATTATAATNIAGGLGGSIPYQTAVNTTALLANGSAGKFLQSNGTTLAPTWVTPAFVSINAKYKSTTAQVISTTETIVLYDTMVFDDNSIYNSGTGGITFTESGVYLINASLTTSTANAGQWQLWAFNDTTAVDELQIINGSGTSPNTFQSIQINGLIKVTAGDLVFIKSLSSSTPLTLTATDGVNTLSISKQ